MYGNLKRGEDTEQMGVIDWALWNTNRFPELRMLYHTPNGGKRNAAEAARFKAMGVKSGVPDLCLPVPRGGYAGLYIEMKYGKNKTTDNQDKWLADLKAQGYKTAVCWSGEEATRELEAYLQQLPTIMTDPMGEPSKRKARIEIYCSSEDTEKIKNALSFAAAHGECSFGEDFTPIACFDSPDNHKDCAACVLENIAIIEED